MQTSELIVSSPDSLGGTPVFAGTRVPVKNLTDYLEANDTLDELLAESFWATVLGHRENRVL